MNASILVGKPHRFYDYLRNPFMWIYKDAVIEGLKELNAELTGFVDNAGRKDLERVLLDQSTEIIIITGHGAWNSWYSGNDEITERYLRDFKEKNNIKLKKYFIRHTCGTKGNLEDHFGTCVSEKVLGWDRITTPIDFILNPLAKNGNYFSRNSL